MLAKEDRELISQIGRYQYNKMKKLNMTLEEYKQYESKIQEERKFKKKIGYKKYKELQELDMTLEEYKNFKEKTKYENRKKYEEKNKIRFRTIRYIERYCDLQMKCQICEKRAEIHHPNYKDYLKINLLCKEHHTALHNFELIPPKIIDLEQIKVREPPKKEKQDYIKDKLPNIRKDILSGEYSYSALSKKYKISRELIKKELKKEVDWNILEEKLRVAGIKAVMKHENNPIQNYRIENKMSIKEFSNITQIPVPTLRKIETGKTDINKIRFKTRYKLSKILEQN